MNIQETSNRFYIGNDPHYPDAQLDFTIDQGVMTLWHTEVQEVLKGQGAGSALVAYAVEYARKYELKIRPVCEYALAQFQKKPDYADVWDNKASS